MGRGFEDSQFQSFVLSSDLRKQADGLQSTLESWKATNAEAAAQRALAYLPKSAVIRANVYPVIKPQRNSFVFEAETNPAIFLYLDSDKTPEQFENTLAHELHHIGYASACPEGAAATPSGRVRRWIGAFGEGFAMLAAAGGPSIHPHQFSQPEDRARWDRDMNNFNVDLRRVEAFFLDILGRRLTDVDEIQREGSSFFGIQGPWYTVGWKMAATIENAFGRERLIGCMCDGAKFLRTYNEAAMLQNVSAKDRLALWTDKLLDALE